MRSSGISAHMVNKALELKRIRALKNGIVMIQRVVDAKQESSQRNTRLSNDHLLSVWIMIVMGSTIGLMAFWKESTSLNMGQTVGMGTKMQIRKVWQTR